MIQKWIIRTCLHLVGSRVVLVRIFLVTALVLQGLVTWYVHDRHERKMREPTPVDCLGPVPPTIKRHNVDETPAEGSCNTLCNLMTTFIEDADPSKQLAQENVLRSFENLRRYGVRAWLFTRSAEWASKAEQHGVEVVETIRTNKAGTPCLNFMYEYVATHDGCGANPNQMVFDGYVNGDIVFTRALVDTLLKVRELWGEAVLRGLRKGVLLSGIRTNTPLENTTLRTEEDVVRISKTGKPFRLDAEDYFLYSRGAVDWSTMPGFVVGRLAYDNWLIDNSFHRVDVDLIDASRTVLAVHQTTADGNAAGHTKPLIDRHFNEQALNPATQRPVQRREWDHGQLDKAHFFSLPDASTGAVRIHPGVGSRCRTLPSAPGPHPPEPQPLGKQAVPDSGIVRPPQPRGDGADGRAECLLNLGLLLGDDAEDVSNLYGTLRGWVRDGAAAAWRLVGRTGDEGEPGERRVEPAWTQDWEGAEPEEDRAVAESVAALRGAGVRVWVFTTSSAWAARAREAGAEVVHAGSVYGRVAGNANPRPMLKRMFEEVERRDSACNGSVVMDGFAGRGLLFTRPTALAETVRGVLEEWGPGVRRGARRGVLVVGKRYEGWLGGQGGARGAPARKGGAGEARAMEQVEQGAKLSGSRVLDWMFVSRGAIDWASPLMPNFDARHPGFLAEILHRAVTGGLDVVDATQTVVPVSVRAGGRSGWLGGVFGGGVERVLGRGDDHDLGQLQQRDLSTTDSAPFATQWNASRAVRVHVRKHQACRRVPVLDRGAAENVA